MPLTRYWTEIAYDFSPKFLSEVTAVLEAARAAGIAVRPVPGRPYVSSDGVALWGFRADADKSWDYDHFILGEGVNMCVTQGQPYDAVVDAILRLAEIHGLVKNVRTNDVSGYEDTATELLNCVLEVV